MKKTININIKSFSIKAKLKISTKRLKNKDKINKGVIRSGIVRAAFKQVLQATKNALTIPHPSIKFNYPI
ncbi:hypothetical protein [Corallincola spongiicola]|uniref:Uncharacterized protein n=1 Tax=Corallincola spongiicola TaxID=2520508 RepID=A0ABY1WNA6_9GAMM|nr:hypothetical protein [Corallincola spongiicola]TAA45029.1 hypothetical protein EXY25_12535 [Corallincola spongiicola]